MISGLKLIYQLDPTMKCLDIRQYVLYKGTRITNPAQSWAVPLGEETGAGVGSGVASCEQPVNICPMGCQAWTWVPWVPAALQH